MYDILSSRCKAKLIAMVNEARADGWQLVGGHQHVVYEEEMTVGVTDSGIVLDLPEEMYEVRITGCWSQSIYKED